MNKHQPTCHSTTAVQRCLDDGGDFWIYTTPTQKWKKFRGHDIATLLILILPCKLNSFQGLTMSVVVSHSTSMGLNSTIVFFVRWTTYYFSYSRIQIMCNKRNCIWKGIVQEKIWAGLWQYVASTNCVVQFSFVLQYTCIWSVLPLFCALCR